MLFFKLALLVVSSAHAFTLSGTDPSLQGWENANISFKLNPANCPANTDGIIGDAMAAWNEVPSSKVHLRMDGYSTATFAQLNAGTATDVPVIICDTNFSSDSPLGGNGVAGVALAASPPLGGHISYAFLLLNVEPGSTGNISAQGASKVSIVIAHEMGHVLGLGHSEDSTALMYYNASKKTTLSLAQDDVDGITYLYPRNEPTDKIMGCARVAAVGGGGFGGGGRGSGLLALMILLAPICVAVRLRRRPRSWRPRFA